MPDPPALALNSDGERSGSKAAFVTSVSRRQGLSPLRTITFPRHNLLTLIESNSENRYVYLLYLSQLGQGLIRKSIILTLKLKTIVCRGPVFLSTSTSGDNILSSMSCFHFAEQSLWKFTSSFLLSVTMLLRFAFVFRRISCCQTVLWDAFGPTLATVGQQQLHRFVCVYTVL